MANNTATMLKSGRAHSGGVRGCSFAGCSCHNTRRQRATGKRSAKRTEERAWKRAAERNG